MKTILRMAALAVLAVSALLALDTSKLKPSGYVNDFARVIDPAAKQRLENYLGELERATGAQVAVVTVESLDGEPIEDAANRLYREWGIGKKDKDEGLLLMLAIQDRKQRAEIGYGLEPAITDGDAGSVLRGIRPILRQGNYGGALLAAAQEFGQRIAQEKGVNLSPERRVRVDHPVQDAPGIPWPLLVIGFFVVLWIIGRFSSGGGGPSGFLAGMILGNMMGGRGASGWGGGGFGGSSGGGGGWGGFGGGDSGGGGASSGW